MYPLSKEKRDCTFYYKPGLKTESCLRVQDYIALIARAHGAHEARPCVDYCLFAERSLSAVRLICGTPFVCWLASPGQRVGLCRFCCFIPTQVSLSCRHARRSFKSSCRFDICFASFPCDRLPLSPSLGVSSIKWYGVLLPACGSRSARFRVRLTLGCSRSRLVMSTEKTAPRVHGP